MTDNERVMELDRRVRACRCRVCADLIFLLDRLSEAERRGMERAAEIMEKITGDWAEVNGILDWPMIKETAAAIRAEAAKL